VKWNSSGASRPYTASNWPFHQPRFARILQPGFTRRKAMASFLRRAARTLRHLRLHARAKSCVWRGALARLICALWQSNPLLSYASRRQISVQNQTPAYWPLFAAVCEIQSVLATLTSRNWFALEHRCITAASDGLLL